MTEEDHARSEAEDALVLDGIAVAPPLTLGQARSLASAGLLAGDGRGLRASWRRLEELWAETVGLAQRQLDEAGLNERVNGEWSFLETLRHLVFVSDSWIGVGIQGSEHRHPLGLPPHFVTNGRELGLDLDARPDISSVLAARVDRQKLVGEALEEPRTELEARCLGPLAGFSRLGAFQVVIAEECFHRGFALRDLAALGASA
jgi:hypothetical protein